VAKGGVEAAAGSVAVAAASIIGIPPLQRAQGWATRHTRTPVAS
jgi:hypothetical protein